VCQGVGARLMDESQYPIAGGDNPLFRQPVIVQAVSGAQQHSQYR